MRPGSVMWAAKDEKRRRLLGGVLFGPSFANRIREICKKPLGGLVAVLPGPRQDWPRRPPLSGPSSCAAGKILPTLFTARPGPAKHRLTRTHPLGYNITGSRRPRFGPNEFVRGTGGLYSFSKREPRNETHGDSDPKRETPCAVFDVEVQLRSRRNGHGDGQKVAEFDHRRCRIEMISHALKRLPCGTAMKSSRLKATAIADPLRDSVGFARLDLRPSPVSRPVCLVTDACKSSLQHRFNSLDLNLNPAAPIPPGIPTS
jgi:hypothetical protein